jgi:hypothetical protein
VTSTGSITPPYGNSGIQVLQGDHTVTIDAGGSVSVDGGLAAAIVTAGGSNTVTNAGTVTAGATGNAVRGIVVSAGDHVENNRVLQAGSTNGFAVQAYSASTVVNGPSGSIATTGDGGSGMRGEGGGTSISNDGSVHTQGLSADAMNTAAGNNRMHNAGTIPPDGDEGYGMISSGDNNTLDNSGSILTHGADAIGIRAAGGVSGAFPGVESTVPQCLAVLHRDPTSVIVSFVQSVDVLAPRGLALVILALALAGGLILARFVHTGAA